MSAFFVQKIIRIMMMVLKFSNIEKMDKHLNKQLLNDYRDSKCSIVDVYETFRLIYRLRANNDSNWIDMYANLAHTIDILGKNGCDVSKLKNTFQKCEITYSLDKEKKQ